MAAPNGRDGFLGVAIAHIYKGRTTQGEIVKILTLRKNLIKRKLKS